MLFVSDLDRTLLNSKKEISESNKNAVQELSNDIYCFGNDYNDIGMFKFYKNTVAMWNTISELKTIAKFVTETNDNDGVAKFLVEKGIKRSFNIIHITWY